MSACIAAKHQHAYNKLVSSRVTRYLLLILPHLISVAFSQTPQKVCVLQGTSVITTQRAECPCFASALLVSNFPNSEMRVSFSISTSAEYTAWREGDARGLPKSLPGLQFSNQSLTTYIPRAKRYGWSTGPLEVANSGMHYMVMKAHANAFSCDLVLVHTFEKKPPTCPLRFPGPRKRSGGNVVRAVGKGLEKSKLESLEVTRLATYVVGGSVVSKPETASYNAFITTRRGNCTGSVIASEWILTAAHCRPAVKDRVYIGGTTVSNGIQHTATQVTLHPDFIRLSLPSETFIDSDIALIKITPPTKTSFVPLNSFAARKEPVPGTIVRATGYGKKSTNFSGKDLNSVDVPILDIDECKQRFRKAGRHRIANGILREKHLCAGRDAKCPEGGVCFGDSGGPIIARDENTDAIVQVGVTSYGETACAKRESADIFTKVAFYETWIRSVTGNAPTFVQLKAVQSQAQTSSTGGASGSSGAKSSNSPGNALPNGTSGSTDARQGLSTAAVAGIAVAATLVVVVVVVFIVTSVISSRRRRPGHHVQPNLSNDPSSTEAQDAPRSIIEQQVVVTAV